MWQRGPHLQPQRVPVDIPVFCPMRLLVSKRIFQGLTHALNGLFALYVAFLVAALSVSPQTAREFLGHVSDGLGKPFRELGYDGDCSLSAVAIMGAVDIYCLIHFGVWVAVAMVLRRMRAVVLLGVFYEALEYAFRPLLPNFRECWWDTWVLDVFGCNLIGQALGCALGWWHEQQLKAHPLGFLPSRLPFVGPTSTSTISLFRGLALALLLDGTAFLTRFFLKAGLWVPTPHWCNILAAFLVMSKRTIWFLKRKWGRHSALVALEVMVCVRVFEPPSIYI